MTDYTIITDSATLIDSDGFIQGYGITVCDFGDTISVGSGEHLKSDLSIDMAGGKIISNLAGWSVSW